MHDLERLQAWQLAHRLALDAYAFTGNLPPHERYGLTQQMQRCAVSVSANIAEGAGVGGRSFLHHLRIAAGSCSEIQAQTYRARDLGYSSDDEASNLASSASRVRKVIYGLIASLDGNPIADI